ncbi:hypothetical protein [Sphingobium ummariense]
MSLSIRHLICRASPSHLKANLHDCLYYDVCCLVGEADVQAFIGTEAYAAHKDACFPAADNKIIAENPAFDLSDRTTLSCWNAKAVRGCPQTFELLILNIKHTYV